MFSTKFYLFVLLIATCWIYEGYCQPPIQMIVPPGEWNLTNNVFPKWLPTLYPFLNVLAVTVQVRLVTFHHVGFYEIWSNYDAIALGRLFPNSTLRRPAAERTTRNKNVAMSFFIYKLDSAFFPDGVPVFKNVMNQLGLDYNFTGNNPDAVTGDERAAALGIKIAEALILRSLDDGFNQLGDGNGRTYFRTNYSDTTGYVPVNTAYKLTDPDRWQPNFTLDPKNKAAIQAFVTPQFGRTKTFHTKLSATISPAPKDRYRERGGKLYKEKTEAVIAAVANLTDYQKMVAEFFDNKLFGSGALSRSLYGLTESYQIDNYMSTSPVVNIAMFDAMAACWYWKGIYDTVRPFSAVRKLHAGELISGWGGPRKGTVQLKGEEWNSYLVTDSFPEHPSGTSCLCWAFAGAAQTFLGRDSLNFTYVAQPGSSIREPGFTPQAPVTIYYPTITSMAEDCARSRVWSGVHFEHAITSAKTLCYPIGQAIGQIHYNLVNGIAEVPVEQDDWDSNCDEGDDNEDD